MYYIFIVPLLNIQIRISAKMKCSRFVGTGNNLVGGKLRHTQKTHISKSTNPSKQHNYSQSGTILQESEENHSHRKHSSERGKAPTICKESLIEKKFKGKNPINGAYNKDVQTTKVSITLLYRVTKY